MFEELFARRRMLPQKLKAHGFTETDEGYRRCVPLPGFDYLLTVTFDKTGNPHTILTDPDTGEEYILYKTVAEGAYVGKIRQAISDYLQGVALQCFVPSLFTCPQTAWLLGYAQDALGSTPEFLWEKTPQNCILRRKDSQKWYAALLTLPRSKLIPGAQGMAEIVNFHALPDQIPHLLEMPGIYPGWHMNKRHWFTVILDGTLDNDTLRRLMQESYRLAAK